MTTTCLMGQRETFAARMAARRVLFTVCGVCIGIVAIYFSRHSRDGVLLKDPRIP